MDTEIMKSVLAAEAVSSIFSIVVMGGLFWLLSAWKKKLERRAAEQLAARRKAAGSPSVVVPPGWEERGCRHCPACHCWTGGTDGPCMAREFCDACKPKFHPPSPPAPVHLIDNATKEGIES